MDTTDEDLDTIISYGNKAIRPGSIANNCLMARRMIERGVPFVQLFHRGWDHHEDINELLPPQCAEADEGATGVLLDLKKRGLLDKTLIISGSEFGRTHVD